MSCSALYYPYIKFQDVAWLKSMSLFYDKIYRIVPPAHTFAEEDEIKVLTDSGDIGCMVDPVGYAREASEIFRNKIEGEWDAAALDVNPEEEKVLDRLHVCKTDQAVRMMLMSLVLKEMRSGLIFLPKWHQIICFIWQLLFPRKMIYNC